MSSIGIEPLVSVVVPAYNHGPYVRKALDSVLQQSYRAIELILLDDQSPDNTFDLMEQWCRRVNAKTRFSRVVVEENAENVGAHATINRGIAMARGDYIAILNSDDAYATSRIECLLEALSEAQGELAFSGVRTIDGNGTWALRPGLPQDVESAVDFAACYPSVSFALLKRNIACSTGNLLFSRELFESVGPFRPLKYCHDWDFLLRASLITEPILVEERLYEYRIHEGNSFSSLKREQYMEPYVVYAHFFANCRAGNCTNALAPWKTNWPGLFDEMIASDPTLSWALESVGDGELKYEQMARSVQISLQANDRETKVTERP